MFSSFSFSFFFFSRRRGGKNGKSSVTYVVSFRIWSANCSRLPTFVPRQCRVGVTYVRPSQQPKHIFHINNKNDNNNLIQKLLLFPSALEKTSVALFHFPFSRRRRRRSEEKQATRKEKKTIYEISMTYRYMRRYVAACLTYNQNGTCNLLRACNNGHSLAIDQQLGTV